MSDDVTQSAFRAALLDAEQPAPDGLTDGQGRPAGKRFAIYRNNVAVSLTEALAESFPAVLKLVGEENFRNIADLYTRQNPPRSPIMMVYGDSFAAFLEAFPPLAHLPYLPDVARLEQMLRESYHAADAIPIDPQDMAAVSPEDLTNLRLTLAPALSVLRSDYPVHAIWAYNRVPDSPKPEPIAQSVLIVRPDFDPIPVAISAAEATFILALRNAIPLGRAAEKATSENADFDLSHALSLLLANGAITSLSQKD